MNEIMQQILTECAHLETPEARIDWLFKQLAQSRFRAAELCRRIDHDFGTLTEMVREVENDAEKVNKPFGPDWVRGKIDESERMCGRKS